MQLSFTRFSPDHRAYIRHNLLWAWVAVGALLAGATVFVAPGDYSAQFGQPPATIDYIWATLFVLGGIGKLFGYLSGRPDREASGMILVAVGLLVYVLGLTETRGITLGLFAYPILAVAMVSRVLELMKNAEEYEDT